MLHLPLRARRPPTRPTRGPRRCPRRAPPPAAARRRRRGSGCPAPRPTRDGERMKRPWRSRLPSARVEPGTPGRRLGAEHQRGDPVRRADRHVHRAGPVGADLDRVARRSSASSWAPISSRKRSSPVTRCAAASSGRCWKRESSHGTLMSESSGYVIGTRRDVDERPAAAALEVALPVDLRVRARPDRSRAGRSGAPATSSARRSRSSRSLVAQLRQLLLPPRDGRQRAQGGAAKRRDRVHAAERGRQLGPPGAQRAHTYARPPGRSPGVLRGEPDRRLRAPDRPEAPPRGEALAEADHGS